MARGNLKFTMIMLVHILGFLLLATTAALQVNDPDPWFWGGFYFICALVPLLAAFKIHSRILYGLCLVTGIVALALTGGGVVDYLQHIREESLLQSMGPDKPYIEEAREFIGSLIALAIVAVYAAVRFRKQSTAT